ncbi:MAG TPA: hypothetical protein DCW90_06090 [Lachnospiraceae bacterium]|nr:hypothetical protein [uncultured Lachnoclostridium sp.]HAU85067.1 hypothetical protein [Lachnospiraceae bacterium]
MATNETKKPNMTKNDMHILDAIRTCKAENALRGVPVSSLVPKTNLSHTKIRSSMKTLIAAGYVEEGFMQKNARTYYITESGIELIRKLLFEAKNASPSLEEEYRTEKQ